MLLDFYAAIGVPSCEGTMYAADCGEYPGLPGYIKFYGRHESEMGDRFENWLQYNNLSYFRGSPEESHEDRKKDRRFFLGHDALAKLNALREANGLSEADLDNARS